MTKQSVSIAVFFAMFATVSFGQNINGSISGRVTDQQGAVVPNAAVTVLDPSQQISVTTKSNDQGSFVLAGLRPGTYNLRIEATGFKRLDRPGLALNADQKLATAD